MSLVCTSTISPAFLLPWYCMPYDISNSTSCRLLRDYYHPVSAARVCYIISGTSWLFAVIWRCLLIGRTCIRSPKYFNYFNLLAAFSKRFKCVPIRLTNVTLANAMRHPCNRSAEILVRDELPFVACIACASAARSAIPRCKAGM